MLNPFICNYMLQVYFVFFIIIDPEVYHFASLRIQFFLSYPGYIVRYCRSETVHFALQMFQCYWIHLYLSCVVTVLVEPSTMRCIWSYKITKCSLTFISPFYAEVSIILLAVITCTNCYGFLLSVTSVCVVCAAIAHVACVTAFSAVTYSEPCKRSHMFQPIIHIS